MKMDTDETLDMRFVKSLSPGLLVENVSAL